MIEKHRKRLRALEDEDAEVIADAMRMTGALLIDEVEARGWCQADVVYALLDHLRVLRARWLAAGAPGGEPYYAEDCAPAHRALASLARLTVQRVARPWPRPLPPQRPPSAAPWVVWLASEKHARGIGPRGGYVPQPPAWQRQVQVGMQLSEIMRLGATAQDLREAVRAGWMRLSTEAKVVDVDGEAIVNGD